MAGCGVGQWVVAAECCVGGGQRLGFPNSIFIYGLLIWALLKSGCAGLHSGRRVGWVRVMAAHT